MSYLTPTKSRRGGSNFIPLFLPFIIFFLILILLFPYLNPLMLRLSSSIKKTLDNFSFVLYLKSKKSLSEENQKLKEEINNLVSLNADRNSLLEENTILQEKIGRSDTKEYVFANVLERPGFSPYDFLVVDIGASKGISVGNKVFYNNFVLGEVVEVGTNVSKIELFSAPGKLTEVLMGDKKMPVKATGQGGGVFEVLLPKGIDVKVGDAVVLSEDVKKIFGFVGGLSDNDSDSLERVFFSLPVNIYEINLVSIHI